MAFVLRRWWPTLALVALGVASLALLHGAHVRSREVLQQTIANLDNVSESRRRLLQAYLVHSRQAAGDATFEQASPVAELQAARYALANWTAGRSGIIDFRASAPADELLPPPWIGCGTPSGRIPRARSSCGGASPTPTGRAARWRRRSGRRFARPFAPRSAPTACDLPGGRSSS